MQHGLADLRKANQTAIAAMVAREAGLHEAMADEWSVFPPVVVQQRKHHTIHNKRQNHERKSSAKASADVAKLNVKRAQYGSIRYRAPRSKTTQRAPPQVKNQGGSFSSTSVNVFIEVVGYALHQVLLADDSTMGVPSLLQGGTSDDESFEIATTGDSSHTSRQPPIRVRPIGKVSTVDRPRAQPRRSPRTRITPHLRTNILFTLGRKAARLSNAGMQRLSLPTKTKVYQSLILLWRSASTSRFGWEVLQSRASPTRMRRHSPPTFR